MLQWLPLIAHWLGSRRNVDLHSLYIPTILNFFLATAIAWLFYVLRRRDRLGAFIAMVLASVLLGYGYEGRLAAFYPTLLAWMPWTDFHQYQGVVFSLVFIVLTLVAVYWAGRLLSRLLQWRKSLAADAIPAILIAISLTFLLQFYPFARAVIIEWGQLAFRPVALNWQAKVQNSNRPDIYYIVLDDESGPDVMKSQLGYDEAGFVANLKSLGYYVPGTVYDNYPATTMSVASTMSASYNSSIIKRFKNATLQSFIPYHLTIQFSPVAQQLKQLGYKYIELGNWYETSTRAPIADEFFEMFSRLTVFDHTTILENWPLGQINQSLFWRFIQAGLHIGNLPVLDYSNADGAALPIDQLQKLTQEANLNTGGRFVFAHILLPHEPYYFNADGSFNNDVGTDNNGELLKTKYVNQVKYTNSQILSILQKIDQSSHGQAVVILQSDEGSPQLAEAENNGVLEGGQSANEDLNDTNPAWPASSLQLKYNIQAAYHLPGAGQSDLAAGADPVNVFRLVFNTDFGTRLPYLGQCYYSYLNERARPFQFADITQKLTGQASPICAPDGSGPR